MSVRIIPRIDIKGPNLVKGVHLEGIRVLGKPEIFARYYYEQGADELLYMDVVASLYGRNSLLDIVSKTSKEIFIPLTVGGGLRSLEDIKRVLRAGADKVAINTAAIQNPELIRLAARKFGSSTIVISIEAKKNRDGNYEAYINNGRERTGVDVLKWAKQAAELGAGEIMITSIDREGTGYGFDLDLTSAVAKAVSLPVIACGGAGKIQHFQELFKQKEVDAVCVASILHYSVLRKKPVKELASIVPPSKIEQTTLPELKDYLFEIGVLCRPFSKERFLATV